MLALCFHDRDNGVQLIMIDPEFSFGLIGI